jgi:hypothetical protein
LPVQQPVKFELFSNLQTTKALSIPILLSVVKFADQGIE